jgi:hypothetical protein
MDFDSAPQSSPTVNARVPAQRRPGGGDSGVEVVTVLLIGGPADFPDQLRRQRCPADQLKIKVEYCGGHEHFERDDETVRDRPVLYRWTMRTKIAE